MSMLDILYHDDNLIAVHKPSGLLVHRSPIDRHAERFALQMVRDQIGRRVYPVHRLDKGTSGILLFALDRATAALMVRRFEERSVAKRYLAIVRGHPPEKGLIDQPLRRPDLPPDANARDTAVRTLLQDARTRFERRATAELPVRVDRYPTSRYALLELFPETGRHHQIRRHLKHLAHPVIGDATHGVGRHNRLFQQRYGSHRLLLASTGLSFAHPDDDRPIELTCAPASDFTHVTRALGWDATLATLFPPVPGAAPSPERNDSLHNGVL